MSKLEHKSTLKVTFGEGGLFSSSEKEKVLSFLFRLSRSWAREWDSSLCVGEDDSDFFSDTSDSSSNSSWCSEVLSSVRDSSSTSSWSSSSSPPLPWGGRKKKSDEKKKKGKFRIKATIATHLSAVTWGYKELTVCCFKCSWLKVTYRTY